MADPDEEEDDDDFDGGPFVDLEKQDAESKAIFRSRTGKAAAANIRRRNETKRPPRIVQPAKAVARRKARGVDD